MKFSRVVTIVEFRAKQTDLLKKVSSGEEHIVLTKHGHPIGVLVSPEEARLLGQIDAKVEKILNIIALEIVSEGKAD